MVKTTFTLDEETIRRLKLTARRLGRPQSRVVREAILDFSMRTGRPSEAERRETLRILDNYVKRMPTRSRKETDEELRELRIARQGYGWRRRTK